MRSRLVLIPALLGKIVTGARAMVEEKPVPFIEGLAAVGKVKRFWEEECGTPLRRRVLVETVDGEVYATPCTDHRAVKKIVLVLAEYKRISNIIVQEPGER